MGHFYCLIGFSYAENNLGAVGGAHIAEALKELTMLQTLHLSGTSEMRDFVFFVPEGRRSLSL